MTLTARSGYDQLVFTFGRSGSGSGMTPTVQIRTAKPPFMRSPSGLPLTVAGTAFLRLTFRETIVAGEDGTPTYTGPQKIASSGTAIVRELVQRAPEGFSGLHR